MARIFTVCRIDYKITGSRYVIQQMHRDLMPALYECNRLNRQTLFHKRHKFIVGCMQSEELAQVTQWREETTREGMPANLFCEPMYLSQQEWDMVSYGENLDPEDDADLEAESAA